MTTSIDKPIQIDKGIPIPAPRGGPLSKYPIAQMKVGDSFWAPSVRIAGICATQYGTRNGLKFCQRKDETGEGGRIWRIK